MGREVKRVALDFDWPIDKIWQGFVNPHWDRQRECETCDGKGYSPIANLFADQWYGNAYFHPSQTGSEPFAVDHPAIANLAKRNYPDYPAAVKQEAERLATMFNGQWCHHLDQQSVDALTDAGRLMDFTHRPRTKEQAEQLAKNQYWMKEPNGYWPTAKEVNEWSLVGFGHDCINRSICIEERCKRIGVEKYCPACKGEGHIWESKQAESDYEAWQKTEPPIGDGWQLWETVSEGSPISPVFSTPEQLAAWMVKPGNDKSVTAGRSYDEWLAFINSGESAFSLVMQNGKVMDGVEFAAKTASNAH